jgi:hypothetical protein
VSRWEYPVRQLVRLKLRLIVVWLSQRHGIAERLIKVKTLLLMSRVNGLSFGHDIHWTILAQSLRQREQKTNPYARELEVKAEQRVSKAQRQSAGT